MDSALKFRSFSKQDSPRSVTLLQLSRSAEIAAAVPHKFTTQSHPELPQGISHHDCPPGFDTNQAA